MKINSNNLVHAEQEYAADRFTRAIKFAQYAIARDEDDARAWELLGMSQLRLGDFHSGIDSLERASLLKPLDTPSQIALAVAYGSVGRIALSRDLLVSAVALKEISPQGLLQIASGLEAIDEPQLAMEACRQVGKRMPDSAIIHYHMGYYAFQCGYPPSTSEALMRHAIGLDPGNVKYHVGLASLLILFDRHQDASRVLTPFVPSRLHEITCECCLKRIATLFFDCDDVPRASVCAQQLADQNRPPSQGIASSDIHQEDTFVE